MTCSFTRTHLRHIHILILILILILIHIPSGDSQLAAIVPPRRVSRAHALHDYACVNAHQSSETQPVGTQTSLLEAAHGHGDYLALQRSLMRALLLTLPHRMPPSARASHPDVIHTGGGARGDRAICRSCGTGPRWRRSSMRRGKLPRKETAPAPISSALACI